MYLGVQDFPIHPFRLCKDIVVSGRNLCIPPEKINHATYQNISYWIIHRNDQHHIFYQLYILKSKFLSRIQSYIELVLHNVFLYVFLWIIFLFVPQSFFYKLNNIIVTTIIQNYLRPQVRELQTECITIQTIII